MKRMLVGGYIVIALVAFTGIYGGQAFAADLVAYYAFDGDPNDFTGNNNGVINGDAAFSSDSVFGSQSLVFDGYNDYIWVPDSNSLDALNGQDATYTIAFWTKTTQVSTKTGFHTPPFLEFRNVGSSPAIWVAHIGLTNDNKINYHSEIYSAPNSGARDLKSTAVINDGVWHHVTIVKNGVDVSIYIDGQFDNSFLGNINAIGGEGLTMGVRRSNTGTPTEVYLNASMDDMAIWNRALTAAEITTVKEQGVKAFLMMASNPTPEDNAIGVSPSGTSLSWVLPSPILAGDTVSCDVWIGQQPDLSDGVKIVDNQAVEEVTPTLGVNIQYYWRVDCYDSNGGDPIKTTGSIWTFNTASLKADGPVPANLDTNASLYQVLSWFAGAGAASHRVYLSDNQQAVIDGTVPYATVTDTSYDIPGALAFRTTYYWRVDEVSNDGETVTPGDVWAFTTPDVEIIEPMGYGTPENLLTVWTGDPNDPDVTPSDWLKLPYRNDTVSTFWRFFDDTNGTIDLSPGSLMTVHYNFINAGCSSTHPILTLKLLDANETELLSADLTEELTVGNDHYWFIDISTADLSAVRKLVFVLQPFDCPGQWVAIDDISIRRFLCPTPLAGDYNDDCMVTLADLEQFVTTWLECTRFPETSCP